MTKKYKRFADLIRKDCLRMCHIGGSGHIGSMLSSADIVSVLYESILHVDPENPKKIDRDRFILSKGHAGAVVYAALCEKGFFPREWLPTYYGDDGKLMGHISHYVPGVEYSTGSLGHGLGVCCGMALAAREAGEKHRIICLMSDGDCNEGSTWEAIMFAAQQRLDNLTAIVDYNYIQALGFTRDIIDLGDLSSKVKKFGWSTCDIDGHDYLEIENSLSKLPHEKNKPTLIVAHTVKGKGVSFLENTVASHYAHISDEVLAKALKEIGE
ncbi:MAG: transketolase [Sphaerochaetaceae bacterium]|nr:transketolase [Sphaerochaetaceae bacterium]MDD4218591.1 transketolase [Sphaerochaetaceae bacterium]